MLYFSREGFDIDNFNFSIEIIPLVNFGIKKNRNNKIRYTKYKLHLLDIYIKIC